MRPSVIWIGFTLLLIVVPLTFAQKIAVTTPAGTTHEMVLVPEGSFTMGSASIESNQRPVHAVYLDAFYIDQFEVTHAQYLVFLNAIGQNSNDRGNFLLSPTLSAVQESGDSFVLQAPEVADRPVVWVYWYGAQAYCEWAGMRLPTEAEWEKAARGTDERTYPWGNELANCGYAVMRDGGKGCGQERTWAVGSKPEGASPYGAYDMAGNVWEWVADWYDIGYYAQSPKRNPRGPASGVRRVLRGGSWDNVTRDLQASYRLRFTPWFTLRTVGFRCAQGVQEELPTSIAPGSWGQVKNGSR